MCYQIFKEDTSLHAIQLVFDRSYAVTTANAEEDTNRYVDDVSCEVNYKLYIACTIDIIILIGVNNVWSYIYSNHSNVKIFRIGPLEKEGAM